MPVHRASMSLLLCLLALPAGRGGAGEPDVPPAPPVVGVEAETGVRVLSDAPESRDYPNLIYNPSFAEEAFLTPGQAEGWQARPMWRRVESEGADGGYAMRVEGPANFYTFQSMPLQLLPATEYRLYFRTRASGVTGRPVRAAYLLLGKGFLTARTGPEGDHGWTTTEAVFRTPETLEAHGQLRLTMEVEEDGVLFIDAVRLAPTGELPVAPPPRILPPGGSFDGPGHVTLETDLPRGHINYTVDGSTPTPHSCRYVHPFRVAGPTRVKARVFHGGYRESPVATADFTPQPRRGPGVPFYPTGYNMDVEAWWKKHPYNPANPDAVEAIDSPEPVVDVAVIRARHPKSTTAGIAEALASLPPEGGTLFFPKAKGPYVVTEPAHRAKNYYSTSGSMLLTKRSHLHFRSDGATIRLAGGAPLFGVASLNLRPEGTKQHPSTDYYFQGLVIDALGKAWTAVGFRHVSEVLFEDCVFRNFLPTKKGHPGILSATSMSDNVWARRCRFEGGAFGIYLDGVHNGGFVDCTFGPGQDRAGVLLLCNNDMVHFSAYQRMCQYIVFDGCTFTGDAIGRVSGVNATAANVLLRGNRAAGAIRTFLLAGGRQKSNMRAGVIYTGTGWKVLENRFSRLATLVHFRNAITRNHRPQASAHENVIAGNVCPSLGTLVLAEPGPPNADGSFSIYGIEDVRIRRNRVAAGATPQVRIGSHPENLRGWIIEENELGGERRAFVVGPDGKPLSAAGVAIRENVFLSPPEEKSGAQEGDGSAAPAERSGEGSPPDGGE